jgi:hypothetical protein
VQNVQNTTVPGKVEELMEKVLGVTEARETFSNIVERVQYQVDSYVIGRYEKNRQLPWYLSKCMRNGSVNVRNPLIFFGICRSRLTFHPRKRTA